VKYREKDEKARLYTQSGPKGRHRLPFPGLSFWEGPEVITLALP